MKWVLLPAILSLVVVPLIAIHPASADDVPQLGDNPTSDDLIDALTPKPGTPPLKYRGLHLLTSNPGTADEAPMPAVGLDIKFKVNSASLSDDADQTIRQLATALKSEQLATYHFLVEGHTDSTGRKDHNMTLSGKRAEAVRNELVEHYGIERSRLEIAGLGPTRPLNAADPANPANRRVQVVNVGQ
jgi:outer membrane protein OmpA-like peptidoglycan-associated protein